MLKIGICDEDKKFIENLKKLLNGILFQYTEWTVETFQNTNKIIERIDSNSFDCNLLFMDVCVQNNEGLHVAKYVSEKNVDTDIIFISSSEEYVFECYRYHTFAYLMKPLNQHDFEYELRRYLEEIQTNPKYLNISVRNQVIPVAVPKIMYIESNYRKVIVHTDKKNYEYYERMDVLEEMLKYDGFVRCHQSYLVSRDYITKFGANEVELGDIKLPVSRKYKDDVMGLKDGTSEFTKNSYVTSSLSRNREKMGALVCIRGAYVGAIVRIKPEQKILIGRDGSVADMVVNLSQVSRAHCTVIYHEDDNVYEIVDYSTNGTFINGDKRLLQDEVYMLKPGSTVSFGDKNTVYKLG